MEKFPDLVLASLCGWLFTLNGAHSALDFALAVPAFYAPAIRIAIRNASEFAFLEPDGPKQLQVDCSKIGLLGSFWDDGMSDGDEYDDDEEYDDVEDEGDDETGATATPRQIRHFNISDNDLKDIADFGMIPPQYQNLTLGPFPFPDLNDDLPMIPWSIKRLVLDNLTTRSDGIFERAFFHEALPPTLRSLTICESGGCEGDKLLRPLFAYHLPSSLVELKIKESCDNFLGAATVRGLAKGLGKLPHLKVFHLDECPYLKGMAGVVASLPRTVMCEIRLRLGARGRNARELTALKNIAACRLIYRALDVPMPLPLKLKFLGLRGRTMLQGTGTDDHAAWVSVLPRSLRTLEMPSDDCAMLAVADALLTHHPVRTQHWRLRLQTPAGVHSWPVDYRARLQEKFDLVERL
ncbi:hypothetical protein GGF32_004496 [Allomyces javanicus]|nr:hypothetical protein GGF32_004496 [Allomyces javanicus]